MSHTYCFHQEMKICFPDSLHQDRYIYFEIRIITFETTPSFGPKVQNLNTSTHLKFIFYSWEWDIIRELKHSGRHALCPRFTAEVLWWCKSLLRAALHAQEWRPLHEIVGSAQQRLNPIWSEGRGGWIRPPYCLYTGLKKKIMGNILFTFPKYEFAEGLDHFLRPCIIFFGQEAGVGSDV